MKKLSIVIFFLLFLQLTLFATTPYNLEGIKALNVLVIDQSGTISPQLEEKLATELKSKLENNGIKSKKDGVGAMFVKITSTKIGKRSVVYIHLGIGEEAQVIRSHKVKSFALTYSFDDMIESENVEADVYDSVMNFLIEEFLEQYHEDNEE
ncbi:MAG: hypothetical protein WBF77_11840 [Sulfurimonadaceae bacterium]